MTKKTPNSIIIAMRKAPKISAMNAKDKALFEAVLVNDSKALLDCLSRGADINARNDEGMTAAMVSLLRGHRECLRVLMSSGLNHSVKDNQGKSIFDYFPKFGLLSDARLANTSCVIASLSIDEVLHQAEMAQPMAPHKPVVPRA